MRWLMNLFKRTTVVNNYIDQTPNFIMEQWNGNLYIMTKGGKLYCVRMHHPDWPVCEHVLTLNSY